MIDDQIGVDMDLVSFEERYFKTRTGQKMFFRHWRHELPKGVVVIVHGFLEHSGRYEKLAKQLTKRGWSVAAMDNRGHGLSAGQRGHIDRFSDYTKDLYDFILQLKLLGYREPPVLLGHSLGGLISTRLIQNRPTLVKSLILSSPFFERKYRLNPLMEGVGKFLAKFFPKMSFKTGLKPEWLSHSEQTLLEYFKDELVYDQFSLSWYNSYVEAQRLVFEETTRVRIPLLVLMAGADEIVCPKAARRFFDAAFSREKELIEYDGFYHEIFNEVGAIRVLNDLCDRLDALAGTTVVEMASGKDIPLDV
jgi:alpha-beta hydrolase superfamily lysophospholipase